MDPLGHRAIWLRNDNPNITYVGDWTPVQANTVVNFGNFGPAYSPTLHSIKSIGSFSLPFHGSSINVYGSVNIANESTNPNPTWGCFIDGISLGKPNLFSSPENNWFLCGSNNVPDGSHELTVNVTSDGMPFYLDYIEYRPSSDVSLENTLIMVDNSDPAVKYISGWGALGGGANQTTDPQGLVNVTFIESGVQLSWYGFIPTEESHNASSGEYSIDGEPFASFSLAGLPQSATTTIYNQLFFITQTLDMGTHVLSAKYTGQPGQTPFTLDYLIVMNGSFPPSSTSSGGITTTATSSFSASPSINASSSKNEKSSSNVGAIVGGIVGSIAGVAIIIFLVWFKFYRKRGERKLSPEITPFLQVQQQSMSASALLQTNQISKNSTQPVIPIQYSNSNSINPASLYTINPASSQAVASVSSNNDPPRRQVPITPPHVNTVPIIPIPIQHEDSGIRLRPPVGLEIEIPPTYTEQ